MGWQVVAQAGPASLALGAHLVCAVGTALVHTDALGTALHLRLLAVVGWGAEANEGCLTSDRPSPITPSPERSVGSLSQT